MKDSDKLSNPIEYIINCCEQGLIPSNFDILNAKDQLKKLEHNQYINAAWIRLNDRGDLYNPSIVYNEYLDADTVVALYANNKEYKDKLESLKKRLTD